MISDAELTAMYGRGLRPDTAARVIDELRDLRARLAEVEAELELTKRMHLNAEQALSEVEAERDEWRKASLKDYYTNRLLAARLAAVEALFVEHNASIGCFKDACVCLGCRMAAAARGEGDRG